ncbi:hypothetical protein ACRYCC_02830 [Actinomadura scrupuli]|uniref:hypothetical protein n=1 Tax=Actinomadura scrupuli TaxID=559629 RepID=UPI003D99DB0C
MTGRTRQSPAVLTGLGLGLLAIGPGLRPGFILSYDMVFVPDPPFTRGTFGLTGALPRHVPSDAVVTALATVVPGDVVQKLLLLAIFVMACASAASLVPSRRLLPRLAAGVCYTWNPYVAERLLLGQWALLLGYAALPWVVGAAAGVTERNGGWRLVRALVPAAIGGFAGMAVSGLTAVIVAMACAVRREHPGAETRVATVRAATRTVAALLVVSLPWLVTGLFRSSGQMGDASAVGAFAARADTPFGALGSLLLLGGAWNAETVPPGYGAVVTSAAWLAVVLAALAGYALWCRSPWAGGLAAAALTGYLLAALGVLVPGVLRTAIGWWAGFGVLRDGQQYVAPLAVLIAVGLGVTADRALRAGPAEGPRRADGARRADWAGAVVGVLVTLAPLALLPSLAWGAAGRLQAVGYPADWALVRRAVAADRAPGDVLLLPWATYRGYPWNGGRRVLDPLPRYLDRRVITSDAVIVGTVEIAAEDPRARGLDPVIRGGGELTGPLARAGIRFVVADAGLGGVDRARLAGAELVVDRPDIMLYRIPERIPGGIPERIPGAIPERIPGGIPGAADVRDGGPPLWLVLLAWHIALCMVVWSFRAPATTLVTRLPPPS